MNPSTSSQSEDLSLSFRRAMRELAGGVCIITVGSGAERGGLVASSVTSLSVEPPTLLVCVNRSSSSWPLMQSAGRFAVNLLSRQHRDLARQFAGANGEKGEARYAGYDWTSAETGAPVLSDALVSIDCEVEEILERHTHGIVIGRVRAVSEPAVADEPLIYLRGQYGTLAMAG